MQRPGTRWRLQPAGTWLLPATGQVEHGAEVQGNCRISQGVAHGADGADKRGWATGLARPAPHSLPFDAVFRG